MRPVADQPADAAIERAYRDHWGRLVAILVRRHRRLEVAEDAVAVAFERASARWRSDGVPANPAGWLLTVAGNAATDALRAETVAVRKAPLLVVGEDDVDMIERVASYRLGDDDLLRLVFGICHPVLSPEAQASLALRLVLGVPTADIARLFLVPEPTMAARLTRARKRLAAGGVPFSVPGTDEFDERVAGVLRAIYLAFTAGYAPTSGTVVHRPELAGEALRLGRLLLDVLPNRIDVRALVALMTLQHARRDARVDDSGGPILLPDQDRSRWRHDEIAHGLAVAADLPPTTGYAEELRLQALIAGVHAAAPSAAVTGWDVIASLYADLEALTGSPVVRLNRAVAVAEAIGPGAGLELLDGLDHELPRSHRLPAVRAELLRRVGDRAGAADAYRAAIDRCGNDRERSHLTARLAELDVTGMGGSRLDGRVSLIAVTVIGHDRPGIIADTTAVLADLGLNLEDSTMTLLRGHFAMMLLCSGDVAAPEVEVSLRPLTADGRLIVSARAVPEEDEPAPSGPGYLVTVHGGDRPGIVSAVSRVIAEAGGNITDLTTRLTGELYLVVAEVDLPTGVDPVTVAAAMEEVGRELGIGVTWRQQEFDVL